MIVWSWNSLYDLGNDRELYFSTHGDTRYVLDGVMDFIKNDCLCDPCVTRRSLMNAVAPSNLCTYWPSAEDWKTTIWCTVQRAPGCSSYIFFSEEKIMGYRFLKWLQDPHLQVRLTNLIVFQTQMKNHGAVLIWCIKKCIPFIRNCISLLPQWTFLWKPDVRRMLSENKPQCPLKLCGYNKTKEVQYCPSHALLMKIALNESNGKKQQQQQQLCLWRRLWIYNKQ